MNQFKKLFNMYLIMGYSQFESRYLSYKMLYNKRKVYAY